MKKVKPWLQRREEFLTNNLRRISLKWPAISEAKKRARVERRINPQTNRLCWHAACAGCQRDFKEDQLIADHIAPVVPIARDYSESAYSTAQLGELIERLLPIPNELQMLCYECHSAKTEAENRERKIHRITQEFLDQNEDLMRALAAQEEKDKQ